MPVLTRLQISSLRILHEAILLPSPHVNILLGPNGSGKTSVLESIHLLGLARSFRGRQVKPLVEQGEAKAVVFGELASGDSLGIAKPLRGNQELRVNGREVRSAVELAALLPLQLINADTFQLLEGGPGDRRRFLDWGVFHVEHSFIQSWSALRQAVQQRNALLRNNASSGELGPWTAEIARHGERVHAYRFAYVQELLPALHAQLATFLPCMTVNVAYDAGWTGESLQQALELAEERDRRQGFCTVGPQRADLKLLANGVPAVDHLSRGQQKLLVVALKLAQAHLLQQKLSHHCLFLVDDLPAELDASNRGLVYDALLQTGSQLFITAVDEAGLPPRQGEVRMFHVKHGKINELPD